MGKSGYCSSFRLSSPEARHMKRQWTRDRDWQVREWQGHQKFLVPTTPGYICSAHVYTRTVHEHPHVQTQAHNDPPCIGLSRCR